jgi:hypothetical protein
MIGRMRAFGPRARKKPHGMWVLRSLQCAGAPRGETVVRVTIATAGRLTDATTWGLETRWDMLEASAHIAKPSPPIWAACSATATSS